MRATSANYTGASWKRWADTNESELRRAIKSDLIYFRSAVVGLRLAVCINLDNLVADGPLLARRCRFDNNGAYAKLAANWCQINID